MLFGLELFHRRFDDWPWEYLVFRILFIVLLNILVFRCSFVPTPSIYLFQYVHNLYIHKITWHDSITQPLFRSLIFCLSGLWPSEIPFLLKSQAGVVIISHAIHLCSCSLAVLRVLWFPPHQNRFLCSQGLYHHHFIERGLLSNWEIYFQVAFSNSQAKKLAIYLSTFERHIDAVERPNLDKEVTLCRSTNFSPWSP